jgi:hypothetical protein
MHSRERHRISFCRLWPVHLRGLVIFPYVEHKVEKKLVLLWSRGALMKPDLTQSILLTSPRREFTNIHTLTHLQAGADTESALLISRPQAGCHANFTLWGRCKLLPARMLSNICPSGKWDMTSFCYAQTICVAQVQGVFNCDELCSKGVLWLFLLDRRTLWRFGGLS